MKGLSHKEIGIIARLEYEEKYFFTSPDIDKLTENVKQRYNIIQHLLQKNRIVKVKQQLFHQ